MTKFFKVTILSISILLSNSCGRQDCNNLDKTYDSFESAKKIIKSSDFKYSDNCDTSKSSWIYDSEYLSCDGKTGFLIIETKSRTYIHQQVPIEIWNEFKKAKSFGKFYNRNLKGRFRLTL